MQLYTFNKGVFLDSGVLRQIVLVMKVTTLLVFAFLMQVSAAGLAQKITLNERNASLESVMDKIRSQTGYEFVFNVKDIDNAKRVNVSFKAKELNEALEELFQDQALSFSVKDKFIVVKPREKSFYERVVEHFNAIDVRGVVRNEKDEVLEGITVSVKGANYRTSTNVKGEFLLRGVSEGATLVFSGVSIETYEVKVNGKKELNVNVRMKQVQLQEVNVEYSTGYQKISKERATGSFVFVDSAMINRSPSSNLITRLDGMVPGLLFDKRDPNFLKLQIRGLYTLNERTAQPLIVIDNFPFEGNVADINPADVENITILRDAAAASIWGSRAGNGVIVITTKKGKLNQKSSFNLLTNVSVFEKPKLFDLPLIPTSDFIDLEMFLFDKGHYDNDISSLEHPAISPVVNTMLKYRNGEITLAQRDQQLNAFRGIDNRSDFLKYLYRNEINTSYAINLNGGTEKTTHYFSLGYDKNLAGLVGNQADRISTKLSNSYKVLDNLRIDYGITYTKSKGSNNSPGGFGTLYIGSYSLPLYISLKDADGKNTAIDKNYSKEFTDNLDSRMLDWKLRPLDELESNDKTNNSSSILANLGVNYDVIKGLSLNLVYQYQNNKTNNRIHYPLESFYTRDLINSFTNLNANEANLRYPVPIGGIIDLKNLEVEAHSGRASVSFNREIGNKHQITALFGSDIRQVKQHSDENRTYGLTDYLTSVNVDYVNLYPTIFGFQAYIPPTNTPFTARNNRFISYFSNVAYTYGGKYVFYASARKDASNIFGVTTNKKGRPFWSLGANWNISKEKFFPADIFYSLNLRSSYGFNGNIDESATATTTVSFNGNSITTGKTTATLRTIPNPNLRWEKVRTFNVAIDFAFANNRLNGSIDYYRKKSIDVISRETLDPTTGITSLATNSAEVIGSGLDLLIQYKALDLSVFKWNGRVALSYTTYKVGRYGIPTPALFTTDGTLTPHSGYNPYEMVSFKWGGLNPENGDPMALINGQQVSFDKVGQATASDLVFSGPNLAPYFGNFFNEFNYGKFSVSANITYRFGYAVRRPLLNYSLLFRTYQGHEEYLKRWQQPGDEKITNVPSMVYPVDAARMSYGKTGINVESGSHIRLENIQFGYQLPEKKLKYLGIRHLRLSGQLNNLNLLLYKKTKHDIDPEFLDGLKPSKSINLGLTATF